MDSFSYVGFLSSAFRVLSVLRFVRVLGFSSLSSLLVSPFWLSAGLLPWLFSFRCRLPPPLPPAIAGSCSLSLPSPSSCGVTVLCTVRFFCFGVVSPCLHDLLLLGFLLFNSLGYLGASLPGLLSVSLRFCVFPGVHVFLIRGFRLPLRFSVGFISFATPLLCLAISLLRFISFRFPSRRFGVCLPWLLSPPFPCDTLSFSVYVGLVGLPGFSTLFIYYPWFTFLSLSFRFVTSLHSLGTLLTRSHLRFPPRRGLPLGRVSSYLASLHSSFAGLRTPSDLFLCLHPPTSLPLLLQSVVHYG